MLFKEGLSWDMRVKCPGAAGAWEARTLLASVVETGAGHFILGNWTSHWVFLVE